MPKKSDEDGTGIKLLDGAFVSSVTFQSMYYAEVSHYLIEIYDDKYKPMGLAVVATRGRYLPDQAGALIKLRYLGTNNEHYQWYIENEGEPGGLPAHALHHFCKVDVKQCKTKVKDVEVLHVRRWTPLERQEAHDLLVKWGYPGLMAPLETPAHPGDDVDWGGDEDDDHEGHPTTTAKVRPDLPRRRRNRPSKEEEEKEESPPRRTELKPAKETSHRLEVGEKRNALDEMLAGEPDDRAQQGLEDKLSKLREKLRGQTSGRVGSSRKPGGILAKRASEATGSGKKKRKKRSSNQVIAELSKAIEKKNRKRSSDSRESTGSSSDALEDDQEDGRGGGWEERRKKYKKIAEQSPGKLMMQALESMQEQLGTTFGELKGEDDKLSPVVTRYLLTVILPAIGPKNIQQQPMREMRTISLAMDMLLKGRPDSCGDVLLQRFKSLCMQARDNSDKFGPHLELLPEDLLYGYGANVAESAFAREMALKEAKSEDLLRQARGSKQG